MAWTEQDYQEIVARLMANSIGVNEVPNADKADDVTSLPAFKPSGSNSEASVVNYPLEFLKGEKGEPGIQGEPGKSFKVAGEYATLEALKSAVPDGSAVDGFMAVGTEAPYDYYAWVNGEWVSQGKIGGIDEAPTDGKAYGRKNGDWAEVPAKSDVLTKTNSESFTPTGDYQPATKKYVDDKHILLTITNEAHQQLTSNQEVKAGEAESKINLVFGSIDNFKNIIHRLLSDNILFLKITEKEIFKVSTSHTYCNPDNGAYELSFIYTYTSIADANNISLVTKRIFIALNSNATNFFVVKDILVSDNLTTLTKKTAAEYEAIGSKDANTAYCVTD
nr:MAG TPA: FIBRITIN T4, STRUCTURAL PROTEIN, CHAPERONE.85A [Caudoviricetes sp.]